MNITNSESNRISSTALSQSPSSLYEYIKCHFLSRKYLGEEMKNMPLEFCNGITVVRCRYCAVRERWGERFFIIQIFLLGTEDSKNLHNIEEYSVGEEGIVGIHEINNARLVTFPSADQFSWPALVSNKVKEVAAVAVLVFLKGVLDHPTMKCKKISLTSLSR